MVFMRDSARAAANARGCGLQVGLHLNLSEPFTGSNVDRQLRHAQDQVVRFLTMGKYALLMYHPLLRQQFRLVVHAQFAEFERLYRCVPPHVDGHQHQHLCSNVLFDQLIPAGLIVRRNFSFFRGEKSLWNRAYRHGVDRVLAKRYRLSDFFFSLEDCLNRGKLDAVYALASVRRVELMTHPVRPRELQYLMSDEYKARAHSLLNGVGMSTPLVSAG
jgi:predicted glycoside hydrolase/deacetylase ChbG (UPF0249 family)